MGGIAQQRNALFCVAFGMALAQRHAEAAVAVQDLAQPSFQRVSQLAVEGVIIKGQHLFGPLRWQGPDNRAPVCAVGMLQRQKCQRAFVGEALPAGQQVGLPGAHAGDHGMMQVIPFAGGQTAQAAYAGVGTISADQQRGAQLAAVFQCQQPAIARAAQHGEAGGGLQAYTAILQLLQQGILHNAVFDNVTQHFGVGAGRAEMDAAGARAIPDLHVAVRAGAAGKDTVPGTQLAQQVLAGGRQRADPRLKGMFGSKGGGRKRAAIQQLDAQAAVFQRQRQRAADHAGTDNDDVCVHVRLPEVTGRLPRPMAWRANRCLAGGHSSRPSRPSLRPRLKPGVRLENSRVIWSEKPMVRS